MTSSTRTQKDTKHINIQSVTLENALPHYHNPLNEKYKGYKKEGKKVLRNSLVFTPPLTAKADSTMGLKKAIASATDIYDPLNMESTLERYTVFGNVLTSISKFKQKSFASTRAQNTFHRRLIPSFNFDNNAKEKQKKICSMMQSIWIYLKQVHTELPEDWIKKVGKKLEKNEEEAKLYEELLSFLFPERMPLIFDVKKFGSNDDEKLLLEKANNALLEERYTDSIIIYNKILNKSPLNLLANIGVFGNLYMQGKIELAYKQILSLVKYYPKKTSLLYNSSLCELELKKCDLAINTITKAFISTSTDHIGVSTPRYVSEMYRLRSIAYFQLGYILLAAKDYLLCSKHRAIKEIVEFKVNSKNNLFARISLRLNPLVESNEMIMEKVFSSRAQSTVDVNTKPNKNIIDTQKIAALLGTNKNVKLSLKTINKYKVLKDYTKKQSIHFPTFRSDKAVSVLSQYSKAIKKSDSRPSVLTHKESEIQEEVMPPLRTQSSSSDISLPFINQGQIEAKGIVAKEEFKDNTPKYQTMMKKLDAVQKRIRTEDKVVFTDKFSKIHIDDTVKITLEEADIKYITEQLAKVRFIV